MKEKQNKEEFEEQTAEETDEVEDSEAIREQEAEEESEELENIIDESSKTGFRRTIQQTSPFLESQPIEQPVENLEQDLQDSTQTQRDEEQPIAYNVPQYTEYSNLTDYERSYQQRNTARDTQMDRTGWTLTRPEVITSERINPMRGINFERWQQANIDHVDTQNMDEWVRSPERIKQQDYLPFEKRDTGTRRVR